MKCLWQTYLSTPTFLKNSECEDKRVLLDWSRDKECTKQYDKRIISAYRVTMSTTWLGKWCFLWGKINIFWGKRQVFSLYSLLFRTISSRVWKINNGCRLLVIPNINYNHLVRSVLTCYLYSGSRELLLKGRKKGFTWRCVHRLYIT